MPTATQTFIFSLDETRLGIHCRGRLTYFFWVFDRDGDVKFVLFFFFFFFQLNEKKSANSVEVFVKLNNNVLYY